MESSNNVAYFRTIQRGLQLIIQASPGAFWRYVALSMVQGAGPALLLWLGKLVIDDVALRATEPLNTSPWAWLTTAPTLVLGAIIGFIVLNLVMDGIDTLSSFQMATLRDRVGMEVHERLLNKTSGFASIGVFENPRLLNLLVLADNAISQLQYLVVVLSNWLDGLFITIPTIILSATIGWWVPPLLFLTTLPSVRFQFLHESRQWGEEARQATKIRTMRAHEEVLIRPAFAKDLRIYGVAGYLLDRWKGLYEYRFNTLEAIRRHGALVTLGWSMLSGLSAGLIYLVVIYQALYGQLTPGDVALFAGLIYQVRRGLGSFFGNLSQLQRIALRIDALFEVLEYDEMQHTENRVVLDDNATSSAMSLNRAPSISLVDVGFTYPGADTPAVQGITLEINAGETVVIVGENGAGKSTLAKLLCRLYAPAEGKILLNGQDYRQMPLDAFRREVSAVFQDFARFPATLRENIGFGNLSQLKNDDIIRRVAERIGLNPLIASLPAQLETVLSKELEEGVDLSGGQWQRVAIARALLRSDAHLVIFDEPTAALDPRTEFEVLNVLRQLAHQKTSVIISHRLALARIATKVVVMEQGRIVETGTHDDLMQLGGTYAEMFTRQASSYV